MTAEAWALIAFVTLLALFFGVAGFWIENYLDRERARRMIRDADSRTERRGSVAEFYRLSGTLAQHRRRWLA